MAKVLHCIDTTGPGGAETIFVNLADQSRQMGCESLALIRGSGWVMEQLERHSVPYEVEDCKGSFNIRYLSYLVGLIRRHRIDLIHAHLLGSNVYCSLAGALTGTPVVSTFHGSVDISPKERFGALKLLIVRWFSEVVAVSEGLRRDIAKRMSVDEARINLIANGIDCEKFTEASSWALRDELGILPGVFLLGSLGNVRTAKSYDVGMHTLRHLMDAGLDVHWCIAGHGDENGPLMRSLRELADRLDISQRVHFLGFVKEPERFLKAVDLLFLCSSSEGHPLALTQAMAAGLPIVATRCGVETVLGDDGIPFLASVGDSRQLAKMVELFMNEPEVGREFGARVKALALTHYDNRVMMKKYMALYQDLLRIDRT